jgi:hypothetical protein
MLHSPSRPSKVRRRARMSSASRSRRGLGSRGPSQPREAPRPESAMELELREKMVRRFFLLYLIRPRRRSATPCASPLGGGLKSHTIYRVRFDAWRRGSRRGSAVAGSRCHEPFRPVPGPGGKGRGEPGPVHRWNRTRCKFPGEPVHCLLSCGEQTGTIRYTIFTW